MSSLYCSGMNREAYFPPEPTDRDLEAHGRVRDALRDPEVRAAAGAMARTALNAVVTVMDMVPLVGDAVSLTADAGKLTRHFDLTPDVPKVVAWGTEFAEPAAGGLLPSHGVEATMQFWGHDRHRIRRGFQRWREIRGRS